MPSVAVKLYSVFFKLILKRRLQNRIQNPNPNSKNTDDNNNSSFGVTSRPEESIAAANPSFTDGVATKDIHIETSTSLALRIFLPETCLLSIDPHVNNSRVPVPAKRSGSQSDYSPTNSSSAIPRRNSYGSAEAAAGGGGGAAAPTNRRYSYGNGLSSDDIGLRLENGVYGGYSPFTRRCRKLPVMVQFHGGGFVAGSCDSVANDFFCRQIAKVCDVIVLAVGYRLAPENKYPAAFEDGMKALHWLAKQVNLAECSKSSGRMPESKKSDAQGQIADAFGASLVEPWLAAHGDPSRCVLLGVSCGANIADYVARKSVEAGKLLDPVKVVAQVLMYPFFIGSTPTHSEIKLSNSYFFDRAMCILAWRLFLPEEEFSLDHPAANPLIPNRGGPPLKNMPPTLTIVAEHDWMRDRAIAYSQELKKVNVDAPVLDYKDCVHEFATLDMLLKTPEAQACADDISIWVKKYISLRGHEFSY